MVDAPASAGDPWRDRTRVAVSSSPKAAACDLVEAVPVSPCVAPREGQLRVRDVGPDDVHALETLFASFDTTWFRPHDLGPDGAREVAHHAGKDVYLIGFLGSVPVAYGMLRGWDEGYRIPALGIAVRDGYGDRGLGRQMMQALHQAVRTRGGHRVRLRVAPENARARHLYASLGYHHVGLERGEIVLLLDLDADADAAEGLGPPGPSSGPG